MLSKVRLTTHCTWFCGMPASAFLSWVPSISDGGEQQLVAVLVAGDQRLRLDVVDRRGGLLARRGRCRRRTSAATSCPGCPSTSAAGRPAHPSGRACGAAAGRPSADGAAAAATPSRTATSTASSCRRATPPATTARGPSGVARRRRLRAVDGRLGPAEALGDAARRRGAARGRRWASRTAAAGPEPTAATSRKRSCAVCLTVSTRSLRFSPGISTTMLRPPWVDDLGLGDTVPLTRWSMIPRASSRLRRRELLTVGRCCASRVIRVPPCRSRPSLGFHSPPSATPPYSAATTNAKTISRRPGRAVLLATATRSSSTGGGPAYAHGCRLVGVLWVRVGVASARSRCSLVRSSRSVRRAPSRRPAGPPSRWCRAPPRAAASRRPTRRPCRRCPSRASPRCRRRAPTGSAPSSLLTAALRAHDQEPEHERDQDERQEDPPGLSRKNTSSTGLRGTTQKPRVSTDGRV